MADPNVNPWYIPGWTDQNNLAPPTGPTGNPSYPWPYPQPPNQTNWPYEYNTDPLVVPANINLITVTGSYGTFGYPRMGGSVLFELLAPTLDTTSMVKFIPSKIRGWILDGVLSVQIPAGFTYRIKEICPGGQRWKSVTVPTNQTTPVDLNTLVQNA